MNLAQIIKYEGDNKTFVWKHPIEDFNTSSQLIVHESQEALFFSNGQACDLFGPGQRHRPGISFRYPHMGELTH